MSTASYTFNDVSVLFDVPQGSNLDNFLEASTAVLIDVTNAPDVDIDLSNVQTTGSQVFVLESGDTELIGTQQGDYLNVQDTDFLALSKISGEDGNDILIGGGNNGSYSIFELDGGAGWDSLIGFVDNETSARFTMTGGDGADTFSLQQLGSGGHLTATITDASYAEQDIASIKGFNALTDSYQIYYHNGGAMVETQHANGGTVSAFFEGVHWVQASTIDYGGEAKFLNLDLYN